MQVIVIAMIALVVLIVLISVFGSKIKIFGTAVGRCESNQGTCTPFCPSETSTDMGQMDCGTGLICCVRVLDG